jgi:hypothetical protein
VHPYTVLGVFLRNRSVGDQATPLSAYAALAIHAVMLQQNTIWIQAYSREWTTQAQPSLSRFQKMQSNNIICRCWQFANQKRMTEMKLTVVPYSGCLPLFRKVQM